MNRIALLFLLAVSSSAGAQVVGDRCSGKACRAQTYTATATTGPHFICSSTTKSCWLRSNISSSAADSTNPVFVFQPLNSMDASERILAVRKAPADASTQVWYVDYEGDSVGASYTSNSAAGAAAIVVVDGAWMCLSGSGCTSRIYSNTTDTQVSIRVNGSDRLLVTTAGVYAGNVPFVARGGISNDLGDVEINDNVKLGTNGTAISASIRGTATLDFPSIAAQTCADQPITVTNAATGSECSPGSPAALATGLAPSCFVSASGTVSFRLCNVTVAAIDPASAAFSARVTNP